MKVFAISDLHISITTQKPMDVFGGAWVNYIEEIKADWLKKVKEDDVVLIGGDISWATDLSDAIIDIDAVLSNLPGKKVIIKGNHDYWWQAIGKLRDALPNGIFALQNDAIKFDNVIICGSRCWSVPGSPDFSESDEKIYKREAERLKLSFKSAQKLREDGDVLIALVHYPPFNVKRENTLFTDIFEENKVDKVVYGHLHGKTVRADKVVNKNGIEYFLSSCDLVQNKLIEII